MKKALYLLFTVIFIGCDSSIKEPAVPNQPAPTPTPQPTPEPTPAPPECEEQSSNLFSCTWVQADMSNLEREFYFYLPANDSNQKPSVLIALHGGGGTSASMKNKTRFNELKTRKTSSLFTLKEMKLKLAWQDGNEGNHVWWVKFVIPLF